MELRQNDWPGVRAFYEWAMPMILAERADEWAIDTYAWDAKPIIFMTPIEAWLWSDIRALNAIFYPQVPVGRFFVDFANPTARVALECDGAEFHQDQARDAARDRWLESEGWRVYRFPGWMCKTEHDPETGDVGIAYSRLQRICEDHRLIRNCTQPSRGRLVAAASLWTEEA